MDLTTDLAMDRVGRKQDACNCGLCMMRVSYGLAIGRSHSNL